MALSCGGSCLKCILFLFNIIFFIAGAALLAIGIWLKVDPNAKQIFGNIVTSGDRLFDAAVITMIAVGAFVFVAGFFGCCGACKESSCMLCTYVFLLVVVLLGQVVVIILAAVFRRELGIDLQNEMTDQVRTEVKDAYSIGTGATNLAWHRMQWDMKCCGSTNYTNYKESASFNNTNPVPLTCCKLKNNNPEAPEPEDRMVCYNEARAPTTPENPQHLYTEGCYNTLEKWLSRRSVILIGIAVGVMVIQILAMSFACCVRKEILAEKAYA